MIIKQNDIIIFEDENSNKEQQDIPDNGDLVIDISDTEYW